MGWAYILQWLPLLCYNNECLRVTMKKRRRRETGMNYRRITVPYYGISTNNDRKLLNQTKRRMPHKFPLNVIQNVTVKSHDLQ